MSHRTTNTPASLVYINVFSEKEKVRARWMDFLSPVFRFHDQVKMKFSQTQVGDRGRGFGRIYLIKY